MKGRYAGVSMRLHTAMLPGAARLAGLPAEPSEEAKRRMTIIRWFEEHDRRVRLTARHFGFSPDTVSRWANAYQKWGAGGLEKGSRRPKNVRQPQTPPHVIQRILELREENQGCGREKLHRLLLAEGIGISSKSIDRVIGRLKARGVLREPLQMRKLAKSHLQRLRRPHDLRVDEPGALVQMDSKYVQLANGRTVFQFGAIDYFTRKRVVDLAPALTSEEAPSSSIRSSPASPSQYRRSSPTAVPSSSASSRRLSPSCASLTTSIAPTTPKAMDASNAPSAPTTMSSTTSTTCPLISAGSAPHSSPGTTATNPGASTRRSATSLQTSSTNNGCLHNPNERRRCPICLDPVHCVVSLWNV